MHGSPRTILLIALPLLMPATTILAQQTRTPVRTPVLVELFTSEGCSSCPPADALIARLQHDQPVPNADIIVLGEHVDYWDSLGWHDRFSSHDLTERQTEYAQRLNPEGPYTPQMVVDGVRQFTGNDSAQALRVIAQSAQTPKLALTLSMPSLDGNRIKLSVSSASQNLPRADLIAALVETAASTNVALGENKGRTLHHVAIVRDLRKIGTAKQLTSPLFFSFVVPRDAPLANLRVVVFVQHPDQGPIVAAASTTTQPPVY